jgi:hypothetical protein
VRIAGAAAARVEVGHQQQQEKELPMTTVTIGRKLIPLEHIAFVEPFDPAASPKLETDKAFLARVVLLNRESVLTEETPAAFALGHGFRMLPEDQVGVNGAIRFQVETFTPTEGFQPSKPFRTRLMWRGPEGETQSKLLLSPPETVLAIAVKGEGREDPEPEGAGNRSPQSSKPRRRRSPRKAPEAEPVPF